MTRLPKTTLHVSHSRSAELPAFPQHHLLEAYAFDLLLTADERDFPAFHRAGMLVADNDPMWAAILRHGDDEGIGAIDAFQRLRWIVMRRHELSDQALHGYV